MERSGSNGPEFRGRREGRNMRSSEIIGRHLKAAGIETFFLFTGGDHSLWGGPEKPGNQPRSRAERGRCGLYG